MTDIHLQVHRTKSQLFLKKNIPIVRHLKDWNSLHIYDYFFSAPLESPKFAWHHHQTLDICTIFDVGIKFWYHFRVSKGRFAKRDFNFKPKFRPQKIEPKIRIGMKKVDSFISHFPPIFVLSKMTCQVTICLKESLIKRVHAMSRFYIFVEFFGIRQFPIFGFRHFPNDAL